MNDEKRHKGLEITIYISLIIAVGMFAAIVLFSSALYSDRVSYEQGAAMMILATYLRTPVIVGFVAILVISVIGLFMCSRLGRIHLLLWYGCLVALFLTEVFVDEFFYSAKLENYILALGIVVLLVLPVIWLWKALRS